MGPQTPATFDLYFDFETAIGERLAEADRLLRWLVQLHSTSLVELDVAYDGPRRTLLARVQLDEAHFGPRDEQRARFWVSRGAGRVRRGSGIATSEREALRHAIAHCDVRVLGVQRAGAVAAVSVIATAAGLRAGERSYAEDRPTLLIDIGGPRWDAARWNEQRKTLVVSAPVAPPLGDPVPVVFRVQGLSRFAIEWARVVEVLGEDGGACVRSPRFLLLLGPATSLRSTLRWLGRGGAAAA